MHQIVKQSIATDFCHNVIFPIFLETKHYKHRYRQKHGVTQVSYSQNKHLIAAVWRYDDIKPMRVE